MTLDGSQSNPETQIPSAEIIDNPENVESSAEQSLEQSPEQIENINAQAKLEIRKAQEESEKLKSKIDQLLTTVDTSSIRKGKTYKGFEGLSSAIDDARKMMEDEKYSKNEAYIDALNNIISSTHDKMKAVVRETQSIIDHIEKAQTSSESITDENKRGEIKPMYLESDVRTWNEKAQEILTAIDDFERDAQTMIAKEIASPEEDEINELGETAEQTAARHAENKAAEEAGW